MRLSGALAAAAVLIGSALVAIPAQAAPDTGELNVYTTEVDAEKVGELTDAGVDIVDTTTDGDRLKVDMVLTEDEADRLADRGVSVDLKRNSQGQTAQEMFAAQAADGFTVWKSWDEPGGIRDQMYQVVRDNPKIAKLVKLGKTYQGRELLAVKLTHNARHTKDGKRDAVLF
ncbi:MAG: M14 family zinc carboxypeptidase, partial [Thermocrispum sp.]